MEKRPPESQTRNTDTSSTCETTMKRQRPSFGGVWRAWRKMRKDMLQKKEEYKGGAAAKSEVVLGKRCGGLFDFSLFSLFFLSHQSNNLWFTYVSFLLLSRSFFLSLL